MTETDKPRLALIAPVFEITDSARIRPYYVDQLLFEVSFEWADDDDPSPRYIILRKDEAELHLTLSQKPRTSAAYVFVDSVQQYYDLIKSREANITEPLKDWPWGMREFEVQDPDGNRLIFGEHVSRL